MRKHHHQDVFQTFCYRPQRSCGKAMFSQASVILFTGEGEFIPACTGADTHPSGIHSPWTDTPMGRPPPLSRHQPDDHCSERYASYWDAFLLTSVFRTAVVRSCALPIVAIFSKNSNENAGFFVI